MKEESDALMKMTVESEKVGKLIQTLSDDVVKELAKFFGIKFMSSTSYDSVIEYLQERYNKKESRFSVIARLSDTSKKQDTLFDWFSRLRSMTHQFKAKFSTELCDLVIIKDIISQLHEPLKIESIKYVESTSLEELNLTNFLSYVETLQLATSIDQINAFKVVRKKRQRKNPRYCKRSFGTKQKDVDTITFDSVDFLSTCSKFIAVNLSSTVSCNMKIDTGADDSVLPFSFYKKNLSNVPLQKTSKTCTSATNASIKVYGFFNFSFNNVSYPCYVADVARPLLDGNAAWIAVQLQLSSKVDEIKHDPNLLSQIKQKFPNLFNLSGKQTGVYDYIVDDDILNHPLFFIPPRRIPFGLENDVKSIIEEWEKQNIITKHTSIAKWNTPLCLVKASTKPLRICMDFSATVNRVTSTRCTLLDNFDALFRDLSDAYFFTHFDLSSAFLQLRLSDSLSSIMTFKVLNTTYKWLRCSFGYKNSPYHMQTFLSWVLRDCVEFTKIYYDDILIYASNMSDLTKYTFQVCEQLDYYNFVLNAQKSVFGSNVTDAAKNSILSIRSPQNVADIRTILGVCAHYADAIPKLMNFILLLSPLCRKYAKFEWSSTLESLFQKFKASILSLSHSYFFEKNRPTYLSCDASSIAIGGVLEQQVNIGGKSVRVPVLYFSKALSQSQINYSQTEKELFALITGLQKFKYYIMASNCKMSVKAKKPIPNHISGRLQRWLLIVQSYCLSVDFIPTSNFCMPDLLSRMVATMDTSSELVISEMCVEREFAAVNFNTFFSESNFRSAISEDVDIGRIKKFLSDGFPVFSSLSKHDK
ncbi:Reverse transcriptase domain-containing protein [Strongyloides ratti]|uniref:Reverse transcriptase domain-containing protein n=1 Tax=Strongyloides ratti TaxID=34506 RepID=A0A090L1Z5_STRRB|nr:Reverse transcriptase domain-containing protein [Strongyloides ratti]CEF61514.1 Reverse transcriptase domain-containing protein [Strongyloides ratti]